MKTKKKFVIILILSLLFVGLGTLAFNAFKPKQSNDEPIQDLNDPAYQNKVLEKPVEGDAFSVDPLDSLFIAIGVLRNKEYYQVQTSGQNTANAIFNVTQEVKGTKYVRGNEVSVTSLSSGLKKVGKQIYITPNNYIVRDVKKVTSIDDVEWEDEASNYTKEDFLLMYGTTFFDFTAYILNDLTVNTATILNQNDELITVEYKLNATLAAEAYRREVKTMSESHDLPHFSSVTLTVTMNKDWEILETVTKDIYTVNVGVAIKTTGEITNVFSYDDVEIPNRNYFEAYFGKDTEDIVEKDKTALDYLMAAITPIISSDDINFTANLVLNDHEMIVRGQFSLNDFNLILNIDDYLFLEFDGDKWYVQYDELIGSVSNQTIQNVLGFELSQELIGELISSESMEEIEKQLSFRISGTSVIVSLDLEFGSFEFEIGLRDNGIKNISGKLLLGNQEISLELQITEEKVVQTINKRDAVSIDHIFEEFYEMALNPHFDVKIEYFEIGNELMKVGIKGNLFISLDGGLKVDGSIDVYQEGKHYEITIHAIDDEIYLSVFNLVNFKITFDDIPDMLLLLNDLFGFDFDVEDLQKYSELIIDKELIELFSNTKLSYHYDELLVELFVNDNFLPLNFVYKDKNIRINLPENAVVNIKHTLESKEIIKPDTPYIEFKELALRKDLILALLDFINHDGYQANISFEYEDVLLDANLYLQTNDQYNLYLEGTLRFDQFVIPFEASFANEVLKLKLQTIEIELTIEELFSLLSEEDIKAKQLILLEDILSLLPSIVFGEDFINLDILEHILSYDISNPNEITIIGNHLNLSLTPLDNLDLVKELELTNPIGLNEIKRVISLGENLIEMIERNAHFLEFSVSYEEFNIVGAIKVIDNNLEIDLILLDLDGNEHLVNILLYEEVLYITYNELRLMMSVEEGLTAIAHLIEIIDINNPLIEHLLNGEIEEALEILMLEFFGDGDIYILDYLTNLEILEEVLIIGVDQLFDLQINFTDEEIERLFVSSEFGINFDINFNQEEFELTNPLDESHYINLDGINNILTQIIEQEINVKDLFNDLVEIIETPRFYINIDQITVESDLVNANIDINGYVDLTDGITINLDAFIIIDGKQYYVNFLVDGEVVYINLFDEFYFASRFDEVELLIDYIVEIFELEFEVDLDFDLKFVESLFNSVITNDNDQLMLNIFFEEDFLPFDIIYYNKSLTITTDPQIVITHTNEVQTFEMVGDFITAEEILATKELMKSLIDFIKSDHFEVVVNYADEDIEFEGSLIIEVRPELKVYAQGILTFQRMQIAFEALYYDDVVKVKAGTIEVELTIDEIMSLVQDLEIDGELDLDFEFDIDLIFTVLNSLLIDPEQIYLEVFGFEVSYLLSNPNQININMENLDIKINSLHNYTGMLELELVDPLTKVEVDEILLAVNNLTALINGQKVQYHLQGLIVGQFEIEGYIKLETAQNQLDVEAHVLVTSLENPDEIYDVSLMSLDGYTYISYNGLNIYAPTDDINKTLKTVLQVMGIEIGLIDSILDVEIGSFDNVFAPYLPDNDSVIDILSFVDSIKLVDGNLVISLNKETIYDYPVDDNLEIIINQTTDLINYIKVNNAYVSETDKLELLLESGDLDFEIVAPEDLSDYHHLEGISTLVEQFFTTAELMNYELTGKIKISLLGFASLNIDNFHLRVVLDENYQPTLVVTFTVPYFLGVTNNKTDVTLYLAEDGMIHAKQFKHKVIFGSNKTEYHKWTQEEFEADLMENILMLLNLASLPKNQIRDAVNAAEGHVIKPEKLLRSYTYHNDNHYNLVIVGQELNGDPNLGDITVNIKSNEEGQLNYFDLALNVMGSLLNITGQFNHINIGQTIIINYPNFNTNW